MPNRQLALLSLAVFCTLALYTHRDKATLETPSFQIVPPIVEVQPFAQDQATTNIAIRTDTQKLKRLADSLYTGKIKKKSEAYPVLFDLFVEWGATDPLAAMAYLNESPQGIQRFSTAVLRGWAQNGDIEQATRWIEINIGQARSTPFYEAVIDGLDDGNEQEQAIAMIQRLPKKQHSLLANHTLETWANKDLNAAAHWIESNEATLSRKMLDGALNGYAGAWADQSPRAATNWAKSLPSRSLRAEALTTTIEMWIRKDADAAGNWLLSQEKDETIEKVLNATAHKISHLDPQLAFEAIQNDSENLDDPERLRGHMIMALDNLIHKNPTEAGPWIETVEQHTLLAAKVDQTQVAYRVPKESYVSMVGNWASQDEVAAFGYLASAPQLSETERSEINRDAINRIQATDPEKAAIHLLNHWNDIDQASATQFASTLSLDYQDKAVSDIKIHYQDIAAEWAKTDPESVSYYVERQQLLDPEETEGLLLAIHSTDG